MIDVGGAVFVIVGQCWPAATGVWALLAAVCSTSSSSVAAATRVSFGCSSWDGRFYDESAFRWVNGGKDAPTA